MTLRKGKSFFKYLIYRHWSYFAGALYFFSSMHAAQADWHGALNFSSDYVYRGYSKSQGNPIVQGHVDYQDDFGWFAGLGLSQVDFVNHSHAGSASVEIRPYLGQNIPISADWSSEISVSAYIFNDKISGQTADYAEVHAIAHYRDWLSLRASVAPNAYGRQATVPNYELSLRRDILDNVQFSAGLGLLQAGGMVGEDIFYWNTGVAWFVTDNLSLEVRYVDSSLSPQKPADQQKYPFYPSLLNDNFLATVTLGF